MCERHFNNTLKEIKMGFPNIYQAATTANVDIDFTFDGSGIGDWNCRLCKQANKEANTACLHCKAARPKLDFASTNTAKQFMKKK
jgi:hypothetical protein